MAQLFSACLGIVGSVFFAKGILKQSVEAMGRLSGTYWNWNPNLPPALATQKAEYQFGCGFIFLAFLMQWASFFLSDEPLVGVSPLLRWYAVPVTIVLFFAARLACMRLAKRYEAQVIQWLRREHRVVQGRPKDADVGASPST
ncbi:MAG TPA: hypothetical protein VMR06_15540 [Dokdonella sp.]|nr:hypothetical protein [Dokdonella sp.]